MKKTMLKKISLFLIMVLLIGTLSACSKSDSTTGNDKDIEASAEVQDTLTVAVGSDAKSLDPHATNDYPSSNAMKQVYDTLVEVDENGQVVGNLAEKYEIIDGTTYKFYLKKGVKFHNGEELKASDVKYSFERAMSPAGASISHVVGNIDPEGFEIVDDYTIIIRTKEVNAAFLSGISHIGGGVILNQKAVEEAGEDYSIKPVGTGPFKFVEWKKGDKIVLERFDEYHGTVAAYKNLVLKVVLESTNRTIELESGGVDIAYNISINDIKRIEENPDTYLIKVANNSVQYLGFNAQKAPFDNKLVRQAIDYAIDIESIVEAVYRGTAMVAKGPVPPNTRFYNKALPASPYNVQKAKELLAQAGYPNGFKAQLWSNDNKNRIDIGTIIQNQLKDVGIEVELRVLEWGTYLDGLMNGEHDMYLLAWGTETADPDTGIYSPFHSSQIGNNNFSCYNNPKVDQLLDAGRMTLDSEKRNDIYAEIQETVVDDLPWICIANSENVIGVSSKIENFKPNGFGYYNLSNIIIK